MADSLESRYLILYEVLKNGGKLERYKIMEMLGISRSTVTLTLDALVSKGMLVMCAADAKPTQPANTRAWCLPQFKEKHGFVARKKPKPIVQERKVYVPDNKQSSNPFDWRTYQSEHFNRNSQDG